MEVDVAVLGGGPAGYTAAIRAAQLGGKVVCIEREPALGGTCLRVGCIPTKAWVQTAHALHDARETFAKLGVGVSEPVLDFGVAVQWKDAVVSQMTGGIASLFKAHGVERLEGEGRFTGPNALTVAGHGEVTFRSAIVATGSAPIRPPIPGLDSARVVDSTGLLAQTEVPRRLVILGGGIIGCEFASIFQRFGSEVTIVEMLPHLIPGEDEDASKELEKAFRRRGIAQHLGKQCTAVEDHGSHLVVRFGEGESVEADLMLVAVGRAAVVDGLGLEAAGVAVEPNGDVHPWKLNSLPKQALELLVEGNERFVRGEHRLEAMLTPERRKELAAKGQRPFAIVLTCADSRVPAELLFDRGLGDLFVVRVAGNIIASSLLASIEYAALYLGTPLCVVMGHSECGAIKAALSYEAGGREGFSWHIESLVRRIRPAVRKSKRLLGASAEEADLLHQSMTENVRRTASLILKRSEAIQGLVASGRFMVVGSHYDLHSGRVWGLRTEIVESVPAMRPAMQPAIQEV